MKKTQFRHYSAAKGDFPLTITASSKANQMPDLARVSFRTQDIATGAVHSSTLGFKQHGQAISLTLDAPDTASNIVFAIQVRFPAANPVGTPLTLTFVSKDGTKLSDDIDPEDLPIVFANYVIAVR